VFHPRLQRWAGESHVHDVIIQVSSWLAPRCNVFSWVVFSHPICYPQTMRITVQLPDDLIQYPDPGLRGFRSSGH